jgi:glycosyltransferase involved in cell wall biosynthesis
LVQSLLEQLDTFSIDAEIILFDDHSSPEYIPLNEALGQITRVRYFYAQQNQGRSKARNQLAQMAQGEYLLFIDCDAGLALHNWLQLYTQALAPNKVVCGGTAYAQQAPSQADLYLHWFYGSLREVQSAEQRQIRAFHSFKTFHFAIPKALFMQVQFEEQIKTYGHEDTLFGMALEKVGAQIRHIDAPLVHLGLDSCSTFLDKQRAALDNLLMIQKLHPSIQSIKVLKAFRFCQNTGLIYILRLCQPLIKPIERQLCGPKPKLWLMDIWKLLILAKPSAAQAR